MTAPILVLGATGKTGRLVVDKLTAKGVPVRVGSRSASPSFDWNDRAGWAEAVAGVSAIYVSYFPDLAVPGAVDAVRALTEVATEAGVRRLVLLSGRGEDEAQAAEQVLQKSDRDWTILRCSWFNQNFNEGWLADPVLSGAVELPAGDVPEPFVDAEDIADVAVAALTEPGHVGELYELTGPRLLTFAQAVAEIAEASGRPVRYEQIPLEDFIAALTEFEVPADVSQLLSYLFGEVLDGRNAQVADGVQRALGRPARDFADFAAAHAEEWRVAQPAT